MIFVLIRRILWLIPVCWMSFLYVISDQSGDSIDLPELFPHADKFVHATLYGILLVSLAISSPSRLFSKTWLIGCWLFACLYGVSDEYHQSFVPGRSSDVWDILADSVGACAAALLIYSLRNSSLASWWKKSCDDSSSVSACDPSSIP